MQLRLFIQKHSLVAYFVVAFLISWCASLFTLGPKFMAGEPLVMADAVPGLVGMMLGPSLGGILLTWIVDGKPGLQSLLQRMGKWKVELRWWAAALLLFPGLLLIVLLLLGGLISPAYLPGFEALGIAYGLFAGFFEEIGWTGFAVPRLQLKLGALGAAVLLGVLHGIWHIAADFMGSSGALATYWFVHYASLWIVGLVAFRIIMVWVYNHTGSVLLAQLMHASFTGSLIVFTPRPIIPANETLWYIIFALVVWAAAAVILVSSHRRLAQPAVAPA